MADKDPSKLHNTDLIQSLRVQAAIAREERAKTDALFLSIGEGIIATDENGKIIRINQRALDLLGYQKRDLIGQWFPKKIKAVQENGAPVRNIDRPISRVFVDGMTISERMHYLTKSGKAFPVQVNISPIMLHDQPIGAIEIFRDMTVEDEMDKLKADFISLASHQLRTPLAAVQTYTNMFLQGYVGEMNELQTSFLQTILGATERMNELISTLLNITRIEAGNLLIHNTDLVIDKLCEELISEMAPLAKEKNITVAVENSGSVVTLESDPALVHEVITNLLSNAIKYTPDGGTVTVRLRQGSHSAIITVADSGYGIPESEQERIFTKFYRATNILRRDTTGTGLGLYLVKNIAERLGGDLTFKSAENKGTTFTFSLPLALKSADAKISL